MKKLVTLIEEIIKHHSASQLYLMRNKETKHALEDIHNLAETIAKELKTEGFL